MICTVGADQGLDRSSAWWQEQSDISKGVPTSLATKNEAMHPNKQHRSQAGRSDYQRRDAYGCCILAGDTERGGLATARVVGSTIGIALRVRCARGWWSLVVDAD